MRTDSESNSSASDTTSASAGRNTPSTPKKPAQIGESAFLSQQSAEARAAIRATTADLGRAIGQALDPRLLSRHYPWITVAAAGVGGFAAAAVIVPSKEEQALSKLRRLEEALLPEHRQERQKEHEREEADKDRKHGKPGFLGTLVHELISLLKPAIMSAVAAGVSSKSAQPDGSSNGQHTAEQGMSTGTAMGNS